MRVVTPSIISRSLKDTESVVLFYVLKVLSIDEGLGFSRFFYYVHLGYKNDNKNKKIMGFIFEPWHGISTSELRVRLAPLNQFKPSSKIFY